MKTFKQILRERGIAEEDQLAVIQKIAKKREAAFKKKIQKACDLAGIKIEEVKIDDNRKYFELRIPLNKLIGPSTRQFCADRWNTFFAQAGIEVDFRDNLDDALGSINLLVPLKFDKESFKEIE